MLPRIARMKFNLLFYLFAFLPVQATTYYKCVDQQGSVSFLSLPSPDNATQMAKLTREEKAIQSNNIAAPEII